MDDIPHLKITIEGLPLSELGLDDAVILNTDGSIEKFKGFFVRGGQEICEAIKESLPVGSTLFLCRDHAEEFLSKRE